MSDEIYVLQKTDDVVGMRKFIGAYYHAKKVLRFLKDEYEDVERKYWTRDGTVYKCFTDGQMVRPHYYLITKVGIE